MARKQELVRTILRRYGSTLAKAAGIEVRDAPGPLYCLLLLSMLQRPAAREYQARSVFASLLAAGLDSPARMAAASQQERLDPLGALCPEYREQVAAAMGAASAWLLQRYRGDLRELRRAAGWSADSLRALLLEVEGITRHAIGIFLREAQVVWFELYPTVCPQAMRGSARVGLGGTVDELRGLVPEERFAHFMAALARLDAEVGD